MTTQDETWDIPGFLDQFQRLKVASSSSYSSHPMIDRAQTPRSCMPEYRTDQTTEAGYPAYEYTSSDAFYGDEYSGDYDAASASYVPCEEPLEPPYYSEARGPPPASTIGSYAPSVESEMSSKSSYPPTVFSAAPGSIATRDSTPPPPRDRRPTATEWMASTPIPEPPIVEGPFLSCEFCDAPFFMTAHREWVQHVATQHLRGRYPPKAECLFCKETFKAKSTSDRKANFSRRMAHIQTHVEAGYYGDDAKDFWHPDWSLYGHLQRERVLPDKDSQRLMGAYVPKPKNVIPKTYRRNEHPTYEIREDSREERREERRRKGERR